MTPELVAAGLLPASAEEARYRYRVARIGRRLLERHRRFGGTSSTSLGRRIRSLALVFDCDWNRRLHNYHSPLSGLCFRWRTLQDIRLCRSMIPVVG